MRGSLALDITGIWDYHLIVVTTTGRVWKIAHGNNACGSKTLIKNLGSIHLEGLLIVPDNPFYGSKRSISRTKAYKNNIIEQDELFLNTDPSFLDFAGKILIGAEDQQTLWAINEDKQTER